MPYYKKLGRLAQGSPAQGSAITQGSPISPSGLPTSMLPPAAVSIPSAGGTPAVITPGSGNAALPPGTVLQYSAQAAISPGGAPPSAQQVAASIGATLAPQGIQLAQNTIPNLRGPATSYRVVLVVQLVQAFPTQEAVQGAIDAAIGQVAGIAEVFSKISVVGTTIPGQSLGPATPAPHKVSNLDTFIHQHWALLLVGALALVAYTQAEDL
jgi:hypothetical protein